MNPIGLIFAFAILAAFCFIGYQLFRDPKRLATRAHEKGISVPVLEAAREGAGIAELRVLGLLFLVAGAACVLFLVLRICEVASGR
jgi:hypothetical protein